MRCVGGTKERGFRFSTANSRDVYGIRMFHSKLHVHRAALWSYWIDFPDLVKRIVYTDPRTGRSLYNQASKTLMVEYTLAGLGKKEVNDTDIPPYSPAKEKACQY